MAITRRVFLASGAATAAVAAHEWLYTGSASAQVKVINLYTARHYGSDTQIYEGFFKKTGIKINLVEATADKLVERVTSEGKNSPADVIMTVDAGNLYRAQEAGIFQSIDSKALKDAVPENLRDASGQWFGFTKRTRAIMFNKEKGVDLSKVKNYEDLGREDLGYKILVRSSSNIYNQSLMASIIETHGKEVAEQWAKGLVKNLARKPEGGDTPQILALASGAGDLAVSNTYYLTRLAKSSKAEEREAASKVGIIFPNQTGDAKMSRGAHTNISGAGVAKNAPNRAAAIQYLEYLATPEVQRMFAANNNEYPVLSRGRVEIDSVLASYGSFKEDLMSSEILGRNNKVAIQAMDAAGWK
jgi:iron(III) transport system substrate-binding protein